jgi:DASS family divalent anion:Na+ symporter
LIPSGPAQLGCLDEGFQALQESPRNQQLAESSETTSEESITLKTRLVRWAIVLSAALFVLLLPVPIGITTQSWHLLAIFVATIVGLIVQPLEGGAVVLIGVAALALTGTMPVDEALAGYGDPIVWLVLAAFLMSRGMLKTGLGRRIAFIFIRALGKRSLGLGYALISTDALLGMFVPSNGARAGGIVFPVAKSLAEAYDSRPGESALKLGAFLMITVYQCDVVVSAMFITGQVSNALIAKFAQDVTGIELTYSRWLLASVVPGVLSLLVIPWLLYRIFPPEIKHTPAATELAAQELKRMGPTSSSERIMLLVFALVAGLWMTSALHHIHYAAVALLGICTLLLSGVLTWRDVITEKGAWSVFIWYGGLVKMGEALGGTGITKQLAESAASFTIGWKWWVALAALLLVYFYAHYGFASITAHATAMYTPFLIVILAAGAPPYLAVLSLAYFSNLDASLTHFGTTPGPIYFGAGYLKQSTWWRLGLIISITTILIWVVVGFTWWKLLRLW